MALTLTPVERKTVFGDRRVAIFDVTFDSAYADDGEALTAAMCGLQRIDFVHCSAIVAADFNTGYIATWVPSSAKLVVLNGGTTDAPLEEAGADDLSTFSCRIMVVGA
jgi:hypothetical protein